jgi:hypothetical protein
VLEQTSAALAAARKTAEVEEDPDGRIVVRHNGTGLPYRLFDNECRVCQAAVVENKFSGPLLEQIREQQVRRDAGAKPRRGVRPAQEVEAR